MKYATQIESFIVENFLFGEKNGLEPETSFLESGIIDSTGILELVNFIEETYHISVDDEELVPGNLDSIQKVSKFIQDKLEKE